MPTRDKEIRYPYFYCKSCRIVSPVRSVGGERICLMCGYTFGVGEGGRLILFDMKEINIRNLPFPKRRGE